MDASSDDDRVFDPFLQEGEVDLEFDPMVGNDDGDEDTYWLSEQQDDEMRRQPGDTPKANEWKDVPMEELKQMYVTIDRARTQVFNQAKTEINILQEGWGEAAPSFEKLAEKTFGKKSRLFLLLVVELTMDYPTYCRLMATFFAACQRKMPVSQMLKDRRLDTKGFLSFVEYSKILRRIESIGGDDDNGTVGEPLWMKIEDAYNKEAKDVFLKNRGNSRISLSLDDDKQKYNYSKTANTFGLLRTRHIQKNRFGVNLHTAATAATCIVVCVMYQRQRENLVHIYERILRFMFGDATGFGQLNLQGITLNTDRGYWTAPLLFSMLLQWGADVVGTVARCYWFPFVYSKMKGGSTTEGDKHNRTKVSTKGYRDTLFKTIKLPFNRVLRAIAFRSGTGNVSLAMSTIHNYNMFDLNTAFPKDSKWAFLNERQESNETRNRRPFRRVCGSNDAATLSIVMAESSVLPITTVQGDACWFQCRKFGLTSSTTYKAVQELAREIKPDHLLREEIETLLCAIGREEWLPLEEEGEPSTEDDLDPTAAAAAAAAAAASDDNDAAAAADDDSMANYWITNIEKQSIRDEFLRNLADKKIDEETIRGIVRRHRYAKHTATITTLHKNLKAWAEQPSELHRKYHWYNAKQLKDRIKEIDSRANTVGAKAVLLEAVVDCERKRSERNEAIEHGEVCCRCCCCCCCFCNEICCNF